MRYGISRDSLAKEPGKSVSSWSRDNCPTMANASDALHWNGQNNSNITKQVIAKPTTCGWIGNVWCSKNLPGNKTMVG
jgi:hypothetical protein